jgi:CDP-diacylglycerol--serine O-phosphatidyltransferase
MKKINFTKAIFPNTFTAFNLLSGFFSIMFSAQNDLLLASYFIFVAVFFDATDGMVARMFNTSSKLGVELDSLADIVSFGVAPAILMYYSFLIKYEILGIIVASIYLIFGAFRLARFNSMLEDIKEKPDFNGLPIPMAALTLASYIILHNPKPHLVSPYDSIALITMFIVSVLMVSDLKYFSLAKFGK